MIYAYGKKNNALPDGLSIVTSKRADGNALGTVSAIWTKDGYMYIAGNTGNTRYIDKVLLEDSASGAKYQSSGYIISRVDTGGVYEKPKTANKLIIGANIPASTSINVYYSADEANFIQI